ncbi:MAG: RHS repeat-associated core domain-containing protein [Proteobacteria bacterium]|nr:RHS repeat-associated core domain-containing protein [Pseudomonadota bacterium]
MPIRDNALGQRIEVSGGVNGTVLYAYDEAGHLIGEYDGTGALIEETVWLSDTSVATLRPSGATVAIYDVHSDQLNTPRQVTRPSDNTAMWTWNSDPFGTDAANPNPAGAGTFANSLRFAGQVFDGQTGLHYNYFREYDPAIGRYIESDPIGMKGGANPYMYSMDAPAQYADPFGLTPFGWPLSMILPKTDDCKASEWNFCRAKCAPARALGCYVSVSWKLKGIRGGEPIRSEQRTVNCNCEELEGCIYARRNVRSSPTASPVIPPWWWWALDAVIP